MNGSSWIFKLDCVQIISAGEKLQNNNNTGESFI